MGKPRNPSGHPVPLRIPSAPRPTCPGSPMAWLSHGPGSPMALALPRPWLSLALALPCASSPTAWVSHALALPRPWLSLALALPCPKTRIKILILGRGRRAATRSCRPVLHPAAPYLHPATPVPPLPPGQNSNLGVGKERVSRILPAQRSQFEPRRGKRPCGRDFPRSAVTIRTAHLAKSAWVEFYPLSVCPTQVSRGNGAGRGRGDGVGTRR